MAQRVITLAAFLLLLMPRTAWSEPGTSMSHISVLWSGVFVMTAFASAIPILLMRRRQPDQPKWPYWLGSIFLAFVILGFIGPIFVAIASILITGRTMYVEGQHIVNPTVEGPLPVQSAHCERILRSLPEWFGIESSIVQYVKDVEYMPTLLCHHDGNVVGFLTIRRHNLYSAEIHVVGVLPAHHRQGIGKALLNRAEEWLVSEGFQFLQVKTLGPVLVHRLCGDHLSTHMLFGAENLSVRRRAFQCTCDYAKIAGPGHRSLPEMFQDWF